ncbi:MAG TPA: rhomboid family intramembrane serine protease [Gemmatimonadales bacterium]|nr:rhomboid family intramembrane serine protease [Gemmatimonadales bacterium]
MFPYRDDNPTLRTPVITVALIAANVAVWMLVQGMGSEQALARSVCELGLIPGEFLHRLPAGYSLPLSPETRCVLGFGSTWYTPVTSMFLHGGWFHLIGNMWFLWVFGNNVEDSMGRTRFVAFYLLCGIGAAATQTFLSPSSPIPMVGASGAISGIMGAYVLLYPTVRVHMLVVLFVFVTRVAVPAYLMLGYWFLLQLIGGAASLGAEGGVAFWAHVGGFIVGALLVPVFRDRELVARHRAMARVLQRRLWVRE